MTAFDGQVKWSEEHERLPLKQRLKMLWAKALSENKMSPVDNAVVMMEDGLRHSMDNIKLRVRIIRAWLSPLYNNQQVKNMEMIVMNEHNTKMQAAVRMDKLKRFHHHLKEGNALTIQRYSLVYGFVWRPFKSITDLEKEEDGQF
nr:replication protein A 70 kDa DNA-binding subunit B [Tanacetum cinerariifolium]